MGALLQSVLKGPIILYTLLLNIALASVGAMFLLSQGRCMKNIVGILILCGIGGCDYKVLYDCSKAEGIGKDLAACISSAPESMSTVSSCKEAVMELRCTPIKKSTPKT